MMLGAALAREAHYTEAERLLDAVPEEHLSAGALDLRARIAGQQG